MSKKLMCLLVGLSLLLIPGLAFAGQPPDDISNWEPPTAEDIANWEPPGRVPGSSPDTLSEEVLSRIPEGIYRSGTPDFDKARAFHISQSGDHSLFQNYPVVIRGYWVDGYYQVTLDEERWDGDLEIVDKLVKELKELGGEDLPIRIAVGIIKEFDKPVEVDEVN